MLQHALFVLVLPLVSAAVIALFLRRAGGIAALVSTFTAAVIAVVAVILALHGEPIDNAFEWLRLGSLTISIGIKYDDLAALMLVIVGIVGLCVHVFSLGYMHDDAARARYFGGLSIFMFSMIGIVLADLGGEQQAGIGDAAAHRAQHRDRRPAHGAALDGDHAG